jgi:hypothetical protein
MTDSQRKAALEVIDRELAALKRLNPLEVKALDDLLAKAHTSTEAGDLLARVLGK